MRYNYKISFDSINWLDFYPTNKIELTTKADEGTFIYRSEIEEIKINKHLNTSVYDTLESWYFDPTKYSTEILVRQYKSGLVKWEGIFGIKQGTINQENGFYIIKPETNDLYRYILGTWKKECPQPGVGRSVWASIVEEDDDLSNTALTYCLNTYKDFITEITDLIYDDTGIQFDAVSSKFWNDNDINGNPPSSDYYDKYLNNLLLQLKSISTPCQDILNMIGYFNSFWYIDANDKLRIEHLSYFEDMINDYGLDLRSNTNIIPEFQFINQESYQREVLKSPDKTYDPDWDTAIIEYIPARTNFKDSELILKNDINTYVGIAEIVDEDNVLLTSSDNLIIDFRTVTHNEWTLTKSYESIYVEGRSTAAAQYALSNYFMNSGDYDYDIDISYIAPGTGTLKIKGSSSGDFDLVEGNNTGTVTGDYVEIYSTDAIGFQMTIKITRGSPSYYRVLWYPGAATDTDKINGYLACTNVLENFYLEGRQSREGDMIGDPVNFNSTVYNKRLKEFKIFSENDIDPMHGVLTDFGIARIESMKRTEDDFVYLTLTFQEDV